MNVIRSLLTLVTKTVFIYAHKGDTLQMAKKQNKTIKEAEFGWNEESIVVVGDGWSALGLVASLIQKEEKVTWILGSGVAPFSVLPTISNEEGISFWSKLFYTHCLIEQMPTEGHFLREYRKSSFQQPEWKKGSEEEDRKLTFNEKLTDAEKTLIPFNEAAFEKPLPDLEIALRNKVLGSPLVKLNATGRISEMTDDQIFFSEGKPVKYSKCFYADSLTSAIDILGAPKFSASFRGKNRQTLLQVITEHPKLLQSFHLNGFFGPTNRDAGEEISKNIFGGFFDDGQKSVWNLLLSEGDAEDNQLIAKKLRRMKQSLDKMFSGPEVVQNGKAFSETWTSESVHFIENSIFYKSTPPSECLVYGKNKNIYYLTDGFGMAEVGNQLERLFLSIEWTKGKDSDMNVLTTARAEQLSEESNRLA